MNLEAKLRSLLSFAWTLTRPTNYLRQNIVFSYPEMIRVSFSLLLSFSFFCYFTLLLIFTKKYFIIIIIVFFFMFRDVPECSGMFRNVPCSGFFKLSWKWTLIIINYNACLLVGIISQQFDSLESFPNKVSL